MMRSNENGMDSSACSGESLPVSSVALRPDASSAPETKTVPCWFVLPYPRAYVDWTIPVRPDGTPLSSVRTEEDYKRYVDWLADYLHDTEILIPEEQKGVSASLFDLSENLSCDFLNVEEIEDFARDGKSFSEWHEHEQAWMNEMDPDWLDVWFEEETEPGFLPESEYARIAREVHEASRIPPEITHADIPYRALMAKIMKTMPDKADRVRKLDFFFSNLQENYRK